ncbi:spore germination lipoprotein GerD [Marininema halotolerans]|nr:spore germination lipoprotein GerD [Marininema halotolerans]
MNKRMPLSALILSILIITPLTACGSSDKSQSKTGDYTGMKQMVTDVLHTQDGKKSVQEMMKDPEFRSQVIITDQQIEKTISDTLTNPKMQPQLEKLLAKPKVAANFAKATQEEHKKLIKQLMKDPDYQKMMLDILKDPEFTKQLLQLMKSKESRQQIMKVMEEALQNPAFKEKYMKLMKEAGTKQGNPSGGSSSKGQSGQSQNGGGSSS